MIVTIRSIFCDGGCGNWRFQRPDPASTLRLLAAREGWLRRNGKDICPNCQVKSGTEEQTGDARG